MAMRRFIGILMLAVLFAVYGFCHVQMTRRRAAQPPEARHAQALPLNPALLEVVSGPFKGLVADYLLLKASVFMGGAWQTTDEDWEAVYTLLKQSLYLDPLFFQTGYYIQGLLAWRRGMHQKAVDLLAYQAEQRAWDWEPMFYVGFDYFFYLKDAPKAAEFMRQSALRPGAPLIATTLSARLAQRSGKTLTAIALLKTMLERSTDEHAKMLYAKRLKAYLGIYQLEKAIDVFEKRLDRRPHRLEELVQNGILASLPANPFGEHFIYEPDTGRVFFDKVR
jgi:tetratricopeptide (TPR) repeat protein